MQQGEQPSNTLNYHAEQPQQPILLQQPSKTEQLNSAISLAATMPPSKLRKNLAGLTSLAPQIEDILLQKVELPLQIEDADPDRPFLKSEFNRDGDSYRSPHTNTYVPTAQGAYAPAGQLRQIQELGNLLFGEYTKLYYGNNAVGSFYVAAGSNPNQFSCGYFAKKNLDQTEGFEGSWDSFNVVDVDITGDEATFQLSTTILIQMDAKSQKQGAIDLTGFMKQKKLQKRRLGKDRLEECLVVVGEMIQDLQTIMRQSLEAVYIIRNKETIFTTRYEYTLQQQKHRRSLAEGLRQIHLNK